MKHPMSVNQPGCPLLKSQRRKKNQNSWCDLWVFNWTESSGSKRKKGEEDGLVDVSFFFGFAAARTALIPSQNWQPGFNRCCHSHVYGSSFTRVITNIASSFCHIVYYAKNTESTCSYYYSKTYHESPRAGHIVHGNIGLLTVCAREAYPKLQYTLLSLFIWFAESSASDI